MSNGASLIHAVGQFVVGEIAHSIKSLLLDGTLIQRLFICLGLAAKTTERPPPR